MESLLRAIEPGINLSVEKEKKIKEAIRVKNAPPEPVVVVPQIEEELLGEEKKIENYDFDILVTFDKTKELTLNEK